MSLINLPENFLYERLPAGLIQLDERALIQAVVGGYQDRLEDLRAYGKKFQLFFSPVGLPEAGPNVVFVDFTTSQGKVVTRSLDITTDTPTDSASLLTWAAAQLGVETDQLANPRFGLDMLRFVDANILDYLATNIGAVLYQSAVAEQQPTTITSTGTFTAQQLANQKLIEFYFPRLKFKGTARSFEALGKLLGFDDVRMVPLWGRLSPRLPNDPGAPLNDPDFSEVPEFYPKQELDPFYDPLEQRDGPYFHWYGTVSNGTALTDFYTQVINGFQPWVKFEADAFGIQNGTLTHAPAGTYLLDGGAPHFKAIAAIASTGTFTSLGEGETWNGVQVTVTDLDGTHRRLDITDRLSAIKYRTSFYNLGITMDADKADVVFGTMAARANKDIVAAPHAYVSWSGTLYGTSPYRPFTGGTAAFESTDGILTSDFLTPFAGTVDYYRERTEATLSDAQSDFEELAKAGQGVTQALEEVRAATRFPRRASYGYLIDETVQYAPIPAQECVLVAEAGTTLTASGTFTNDPLPPYTTGMTLYLDGVAYLTEDTTDSRYPERVIHQVVVGTGTLSGFTVPSAGSYNVTLENNTAFNGTACVDFYGTVSGIYTGYSDGTAVYGAYPNTHEVVRPDGFTGTQVFAIIGDYGLAANMVPGGPAYRVAARLHTWNPEIIISTGDNNYYAGSASTIHANNTVYWPDIREGRMFPCLGNHDLNTDNNGDIQVSYFFNGTAPGPGNGRYYNVRRGNVEFFCLNPGWSSAQVAGATGDPNYAVTLEPDGNTYDSIQGQWLKNALAASTALWKIVFFHFPPYASSTSTADYSPGYPRMRWPFREWGATIVFTGHVHTYERLEVDGFPYVIMGISGENNRVYDGVYVSPGSKVRYAASPGPTNYGATKVIATSEFIRFETWNANYALPIVDSFQINRSDLRYMVRPEDEMDDDLVYETLDEYPYRRDILLGGETIETDYYATSGTNFEQYSILEQTMAVKDQTEVDHEVNVVFGNYPIPQFVVRPKPLPYVPGQRAICYRGNFRNLASLTTNDTGLTVVDGGRSAAYRSELDTVFQPGYQLFHAGIVNGVLLADPDKFNGSHHLTALQGWLPFNEHPESPVTVKDAVLTLASQSLTGVAAQDRVWDNDHGLSLRVMPGARIESSAFRNCTDDITVSFWFKLPDLPAFGSVQKVFEFGAVKGYVAPVPNHFRFEVDGNAVDTWDDAGWMFVCCRKQANRLGGAYSAGFGALTYYDQVEPGLTANTGTDLLSFFGADVPYEIRDVRIWNTWKTDAELALVQNHSPVPTVVPYRVGHVLSLNTGDRYGLRVLPNGWLAPAALPGWVRSPKFAQVVRYDANAEYKGEAYRKEVGLGGGQIPPTPWTLGQQFYSLTADGTITVAPQLGAVPGVNAFWQADTGPGSYIVLSGSVSAGTTAVVTASGSGASPWPNLMEATNPVQESIWLHDDDGHVYQVKLEASGTGAAFTAIPGTISNQEQGDAQAFLATSGTYLGVTGYGSVVQKAYSGTVVTPSLFMYLNDTLLEDVGGAQTLTRWTDPTSFGLDQGVPALDENGELAFTNSSTLRAGNYRLTLDLGNIGKVDDEFDGFRIDVTVADTTFNQTALSGYKGSNFRALHNLDFNLDHDVNGDWLLSLDWLNAFSDPARGLARQLAVYGYKLRRLETSLYEVTLAGAGTEPVLTRLSLVGQQYGTIPGGWLISFNSYGTVTQSAHEGTVYPSNDTLTSRYPLADLLTGQTNHRREDVISAGTFCLYDDATISVSLGTI